jgi:hypothetical protein
MVLLQNAEPLYLSSSYVVPYEFPPASVRGPDMSGSGQECGSLGFPKGLFG